MSFGPLWVEGARTLAATQRTEAQSVERLTETSGSIARVAPVQSAHADEPPAPIGPTSPEAEEPRRGIWTWLTGPAPEITDTIERIRARVLATILLLGVPAGLAAAIVLGRTHQSPPAQIRTMWVMTALLAVGYALSRTRHYAIAAGLTVGVAIVSGLADAVWAPDIVRVQASLGYALLGVLLCAVFFRASTTLLVAAGVLGGAVVVAVQHPAVEGAALQELVVDAGITALVFSVLSLLQVGVLKDLQAARTEVATSRGRFDLAARGANDGLWDWDMKEGTAWFSPRWAALLGVRELPEEATLSLWLDRVHRKDASKLRADLSAHVAALTPHFENTHRIRHADGTWRWVHARGLAVRDSAGRVQRMAGSITDITERKQFEEQLLHDAFHDVLSGLPNRALFLNRLAHSIARSQRRSSYLFAVLFLDLDRFKIVNDSLGHRVGDALLVQIARRIEACIRPGDTVARLGGDEFTILLDDLEEAGDAALVAERIQKALHKPFMMERQEIVTSASIGIAMSTGGYRRPEDLIRDADTAMYKAKAAGKARHMIFDSAMHEHAVEVLKLEADLRRAVANEEFVLHYQPIISLQTGRIEAFEALVRWPHPERGLVMPGDFIPMAEETGLINPLGWTVLRQACQQTKIWREAFPKHRDLQVNVNLSGRQFRQSNLVEGIVEILETSGLEAEALRLEITETVVMESAQASRELLEQLRSLGLRLCIDDFGTGYSSLNYLHDFDIDSLKIDRSFVARMGGAARPEIVQTIVDLSRSLALSVTAEGVETDGQLAQLRELDCELAQGYFFARPMDVDAADRMLWRDPKW